MFVAKLYFAGYRFRLWGPKFTNPWIKTIKVVIKNLYKIKTKQKFLKKVFLKENWAKNVLFTFLHFWYVWFVMFLMKFYSKSSKNYKHLSSLTLLFIQNFSDKWYHRSKKLVVSFLIDDMFEANSGLVLFIYFLFILIE